MWGQVTELATDSLATVTEGVTGMAASAVGAAGEMGAASVGRLSELGKDTRPSVGVSLHCEGALRMRPNGEDVPYESERGSVVYTFSLEDEEEMDGLAAQVRRLYDIAQEGAPAWHRPEELVAMIEEREAGMSFDGGCLEEEENTLFESKAMRISPLVSNPGRVLLTDQRLYFQPFNGVQESGVTQWNLQAKAAGGGKTALEKLERRRHQLRKTGVELVFGSGEGAESVFLAFPSNAQRETFVRLTCENTLMTDGAREHEEDMRRAAEQWQQKRMSNYQYLMHLNSAAGRSVNDIVQYPVYPWVLKDYESETLDLTDPESFRDLSKPIGALESKRLESVVRRYEELLELDDPAMPPFMWGSHYSTAGYVLYYLAREAPDLMLRLQSGSFDKPDRLFSSIARTWRGVLENPMDVKELIPEFYTPSSSGFLRNVRGIAWGARQDGTTVGDVELPPWAADESDFVAQMAEALESDYVSEHLHEWIDLIFGHKQQGKRAVAAANVFRHLSYEGAVDLRAIDDPQERAAILTQINEFGQTPSQLFDGAHPKRSDRDGSGLSLIALDVLEQDIGGKGRRKAGSRSRSPGASARASGPRPKRYLPVVTEPEQLGEALGAAWVAGGAESLRLRRQYQLRVPLPLLGLAQSAEGGLLYTTGSPDATLRTIELDLTVQGGVASAPQSRSAKLGAVALSCVCLAEGGQVALVGSWDNSIYVYWIEYGRVVEHVPAHDAGVCAMALQGETLLSASWDGTIKVWKLRRGVGGVRLEHMMTLAEHEAEVSCVAIGTKRGKSSGKDYDGSSWACSGSVDGSLCVWCIDEKRTGTGCLATGSGRLSAIEPHQGAVTAVAWTSDGCFVASAGEDLVVRLHRVLGTGVSGLAAVEHLLDVTTFGVVHALEWVGDSLLGGGDEALLEVRAPSLEGGSSPELGGCTGVAADSARECAKVRTGRAERRR